MNHFLEKKTSLVTADVIKRIIGREMFYRFKGLGYKAKLIYHPESTFDIMWLLSVPVIAGIATIVIGITGISSIWWWGAAALSALTIVIGGNCSKRHRGFDVNNWFYGLEINRNNHTGYVFVCVSRIIFTYKYAYNLERVHEIDADKNEVILSISFDDPDLFTKFPEMITQHILLQEDVKPRMELIQNG